MARPRIPIWKKIQDNSVKVPESGCWIWVGPTTIHGYGRLTFGARTNIGAHRASYELKHGKIPDGFFALHHCDIKCCVNPDHIFVGTQQQNMDDKVQKKRQAKGHRHGMSKLTEEQAKEAKFSNQKAVDLANKFNCSATMIRQIRSGLYWRHLENT
jgi:hypothetical protein